MLANFKMHTNVFFDVNVLFVTIVFYGSIHNQSSGLTSLIISRYPTLKKLNLQKTIFLS